jgi:c-di-GMP-binding flagellar brake protein YcgR
MSSHVRPAAPGSDPAATAPSDFLVAGGAERLQLLEALRDGAVPVQLSAPEGVSVTTQLWVLDAAQGSMSFGADAANLRMQQLAQCDEAVAVAYLDQVKLQFDLADLLLVHGRHDCVLRAALPQRMYRFQRRAGYRVRISERRAPRVVLRHPSMPDMLLTLRIVDISVGGCALALPDDVPALQPGTQLAGVRVELADDTVFDATLRLQHVSALHGAGHGQRLGCAFADLGGTAQRSLQRCIDHAQRRRLPARG